MAMPPIYILESGLTPSVKEAFNYLLYKYSEVGESEVRYFKTTTSFQKALEKEKSKYLILTSEIYIPISYLKNNDLASLIKIMEKDTRISCSPLINVIPKRKKDFSKVILWRTSALKSSYKNAKISMVNLPKIDAVFPVVEEGVLSDDWPGKINVLGINTDDIRYLIQKRYLISPMICQYGTGETAPMYDWFGHNFMMTDLNDYLSGKELTKYKQKYGFNYKTKRGKRPPKEIPNNLSEQFTLGGRIRVTSRYYDGTYQGEMFYAKSDVDENIKNIKTGYTNYYGMTDAYLYKAFEDFPIKGKEVAIMGSMQPWYESITLAYGGKPVTIEYNKITTNDNRLELLTVAEFDKHPRKFDAGISISSFEHDGLGRYGDAIDPWADLKAMDKMKGILKPNAIFYFAVPVGFDTVQWNGCRVYGQIRLPLLLQGWKIVATVGFEQKQYGLDDWHNQPLFILQNV